MALAAARDAKSTLLRIRPGIQASIGAGVFVAPTSFPDCQIRR
jgi:hypothetical protein